MNTENKKEQEKFIVDLYMRVSTDRQAKEGDSLEEQENELKKFCDYRNFQVRNVFIERGKSGKNTNRPEYQNLIADIKAQKINAVVVKKIDRLSRSLLDFEDFMNLLQKHEIEFISLRESFDTTTALGKAMLRITLVFAQLEREQTAERIKDVMDYRASQGLYNGSAPPYGYINLDKALVPLEKEKVYLELIFDKFILLKSIWQVTKLLNESKIPHRKGRLWTETTIKNILTNPIYKGYVTWNGTLYRGVHKPLISEKKFELVQGLIKRASFMTKEKNKALLQKILVCGICGSNMTPSFSYNHQKIKYFYYKCTKGLHMPGKKENCTIGYINLEKLEKQVLSFLLSLSQSDMFSALELQILKYNQSIEQELRSFNDQVLLFEKRIQATITKKDAYLDSLIASPFLSSERKLIQDRIQTLEQEELQIKTQVYAVQLEISQTEDQRIDLIQFKKTIIEFKSAHDTFSYEEMKNYYKNQFQEIRYFKDKLSIQFLCLPWSLDWPLKETP